MANAARDQGVQYIFGEKGHVKQLFYDRDGTCKGAIAADGTVHRADVVVLATGANTATLVEAKTEVVAQTSVICVIQLEPHEIEKYRNIPIIDDFDQGKPPPFNRQAFGAGLRYNLHWALALVLIRSNFRHHLSS